MGNLIMRHKAFVGPPSFWNFRPANENFEKIREQAEAFINAIGAENIVSVTELAPSYGGVHQRDRCGKHRFRYGLSTGATSRRRPRPARPGRAGRWTIAGASS